MPVLCDHSLSKPRYLYLVADDTDLPPSSRTHPRANPKTSPIETLFSHRKTTCHRPALVRRLTSTPTSHIHLHATKASALHAAVTRYRQRPTQVWVLRIRVSRLLRRFRLAGLDALAGAFEDDDGILELISGGVDIRSHDGLFPEWLLEAVENIGQQACGTDWSVFENGERKREVWFRYEWFRGG